MQIAVTIAGETRTVEFQEEALAGSRRSVAKVGLVRVGRGQKLYPVAVYADTDGYINQRAYALGKRWPILAWNDEAFAPVKTIRNGFE